MKVLVADKFEKSGIDGLKALQCEVLLEPDLQGEALQARLSDSGADILIVRSTKVTAPMIEGSTLSLIIRAGAGYNTIDVAAASDKGIYVSNCPGKNSRAVAELAFGLLLACDRHIADNVLDLRSGKWNKKAHSKARGLYGRTLGLIGLGQISQEMITRAKAFGMNIIVHSRWITSETAAALGVGKADSFEDLAERSDFVSVHSALTPETRGSLGESFFKAMRPGTVFVNTSRGEVVVESALVEAVKTGGIVAGLDVFENEPSGGEGVYEGPLKDLPGVYVTHHIGASTDQAQEAVAAETVRIVQEFKRTGIVPNVVNVRKAEIATHLIVVRHVDRVGVLASVLAILKDEGASIQEMENIILSGAKAAIAQISLDKELSPAGVHAIHQISGVFDIAQFPISKA
jgi:D-3-phosphoglycerate dehydrogenase